MIFATVATQKKRAEPGMKGTCPNCGEVVFAKCGNYKVWHWSHSKSTNCDSWSEGETEWHLAWKSYFPEACQEVVCTDDDTKERHIADVLTENCMVIELQNSRISDEEIRMREAFYKKSFGKMMWIVNGNNLGFLRENFRMGLSDQVRRGRMGPFSDFSRSRVFQKWSKSSVDVFFDFDEGVLFWLKEYDSKKRKGIVRPVPSKDLVEKNGGLFAHAED